MSRYGSRIAALERRAERDRAAVDEAAGGAEADAETYLREGAGQAIWLYVEARTGGRMVPFSPPELAALRRAMNCWLECYTRCYGVEFDAEFTVREAAELLVQTRNVDDVGQLLTGVPPRDRERVE
ncbi:hypothetical protein GS429_10430 [Natronorubrum sp. JWXQ-INN-674]|uniref:DUF8055 domain-containing protein n=1 Tax=Natronorubrum halalkaliphilum TaxID=2691917 RepID=A0A6B0VMN5_9EURY|nr:hypothetical protein [Natronorubrum halalkaliphilum]MXV62473.1 hypothetical protein [Natronorubrum halalkaliphilum]